VLDISHVTLAYSILENFRGLELPRTRTRTWSKIGPRGSSRTRTFLEDNNTGSITRISAWLLS